MEMILDASVGQCFLTEDDRSRLMHEAESEIAAGHIDAAMVPFIRRLNAIPWLATTQCCQGHRNYNGSKALCLGSISLRANIHAFPTFLAALARYQASCGDGRYEESGWFGFDVEQREDGSDYIRFLAWWTRPAETESRMDLLCRSMEGRFP